jgi:predicted PurR-regulated permease PerM
MANLDWILSLLNMYFAFQQEIHVLQSLFSMATSMSHRAKRQLDRYSRSQSIKVLLLGVACSLVMVVSGAKYETESCNL